MEFCPRCTHYSFHEFKMKDPGIHDFAKSNVAKAVSQQDWKVVVNALASIGALHLASQLIHFKRCSNCGHFQYLGTLNGK